MRALRQDYERRERRSDTMASAPTKIVIETGTGVSPSEVQSLKRKLALTEQQLKDAQNSWNERLKEAAACQVF